MVLGGVSTESGCLFLKIFSKVCIYTDRVNDERCIFFCVPRKLTDSYCQSGFD